MNRLWMMILAMGLGIVANVHAADFVFKVPVEVRNLNPEVSRVSILCNVTRSDGGEIGGGETIIDVTRDETGVGSLIRPASNPVVVEVNMYYNRSPDEAKKYICRLRLINREGERSRPEKADDSHASRFPYWALADPGHPLDWSVIGSLSKFSVPR